MEDDFGGHHFGVHRSIGLGAHDMEPPSLGALLEIDHTSEVVECASSQSLIRSSQLFPSMLDPTRTKPVQPSKEQWNSVLKPIIRNLYIEKNIIQKEVITILDKKHGFKITPKQLTNRLKEWNLWKNTTPRQRNCILKNPEGGLRGHGGSRSTVKITQSKLNYWKKEKFMSSGRNYIHNMDIEMRSNSEPHEDDTNMTDANATIGAKATNGGTDLNMETRLAKSVQGPWPFSSWDSVDVMNSPGLTRLFAKLKLECQDEVPDLELPPPILPVSSMYPQYVSCFELVAKTSDDTESEELDIENAHTTLSLATYTSCISTSSKRRDSGFAFLCNNVDFPLPEFITHYPSPTPFNEVYVFPTNLATKPRNPRCITTWKEIRDQHTKLQHIESGRLSSFADPKFVNSIRIFVKTCLLSYYREEQRMAQYWCQRLLDNDDYGRYRSTTTNMMDRLDLVEALYNRKRYQEALEILAVVDNDVVQSSIASDEILIRLLRLKTSRRFRKHTKVHSLNYLQKCLSTLGPKHEETMVAMCRFSESLEIDTSKREELLRNAVQIGLKSAVTYCRVVESLARLKYNQKQYEEAIFLATRAMEMGKESFETYEYAMTAKRSKLCVIDCLLQQGKVQECLKLIGDFFLSDARVGGKLVDYLCRLARTAYICENNYEERQVMSVGKLLEKKRGMKSDLLSCREWIHESIYETRERCEYELHWINYLDYWYEKQKRMEEDQAAECVREFVTVEE